MFFNLNKSRIRPIVAAAVVFFSATSANAINYNVSFDGPVIDLSGFIETNAVGTFSSTAFDALVTDFSITASANGAAPFVFTSANSSWGGAFDSAFGANVSVSVAASAIELLAPLGDINSADNVFLIADNPTNFVIENLSVTSTQLRYRLPRPPDGVIFDTVSNPFVLATAQQVSAVPLPAALPLFGTGLAVMGFVGWRRKRKVTAAV